MCCLLFLAFRNWDKAAFYAFSPDECHEMAEPMATLGPRLEKLFKTPAWVHTVVTASDDVVTLMMVMVGYFERIGMLDRIVKMMTPSEKPEKKERKEDVSYFDPTSVPTRNVNGYSRQAIDPREQYNIPGLGDQYRTDI